MSFLRIVPERDIVLDKRGKPYTLKKAVPILIFDGRGTSSGLWGCFRRMVLKRDDSTCQDCGESNIKKAIVHHILPVKDYPNLYFEMDNAKTLCVRCHKKHKRL